MSDAFDERSTVKRVLHTMFHALYTVKHYQSLTGTVLVRVAREYCQMLLASIATIHMVQHQPAFFHTIHVAGIRTVLQLESVNLFQFPLLSLCILSTEAKPKTRSLLHLWFLAGSIRSCQKALVKYHRSQIPAILAECETPGSLEWWHSCVSYLNLTNSTTLKRLSMCHI